MALLRFLGIGEESKDEKGDTATVRRIAAKLERLGPEKAKFVAAFAYVLARIANADLAIDDSETSEMQRCLRALSGLSESEAALALSQRWEGENNFVFPPPSELPRIAQLLYEQPAVSATVVAPFWPAQAWFQQLTELAVRVETHGLHSLALLPGWLHGSARTALSGAMLTLFRVAGRQAGTTDRPSRA